MTRPGDVPRGRERSYIVRLVLVLLCASALLPGCAGQNYVTVRHTPSNPLADQLQLVSRSGPKPTPRTEQLLRRYAIPNGSAEETLVALEQEIAREPRPDKHYAYAEVAYVQGKRAEGFKNYNRALELYASSLAHAYWYLFDESFDHYRNPYDPQFRSACDVYNGSLEAALRIIDKRGQLRPGPARRIETSGPGVDLEVTPRGRWQPQDFDRLQFVTDYEVNGLTNHHHTYGLGVPMIAQWRRPEEQTDKQRYYPPGLSFAVTAFLRVADPPTDRSMHSYAGRHCVLELHDTVARKDVDINSRRVPLETDLTTPLACFLQNPEFGKQQQWVANTSLLFPDRAKSLTGLFMLEPYDPEKVPVLLIHGLWSSPLTWMDMFNDLRSFSEIRDQYQFWFYLYPTGQSFWLSAWQLRRDLEQARSTLDPQHTSPALDQMVLVGHSMGGLVARVQTVDSEDRFWRILSDRPFEELKADDETRETLAQMLFFRPNESVRRVITIGTPHRGSDYANSYTQWLGRRLIWLPEMMVSATQRVARDNPGFFHNTELLTVNTSIDSLSPDFPVLPVLLTAPRAPWTRYHNVVACVPEEGWLGSLAAGTDGVVAYASAHLEDVDSEIVVESDHVNVHRNPKTILEVRRILLEHRLLAQAEIRQAHEARRISAQTRGIEPNRNRPGSTPSTPALRR